MNESDPASLIQDANKADILNETAKIPWRELQRFFASGKAIHIDESEDLVDVAYQFSVDNKAFFESRIAEAKIAAVSDATALEWFESDALVWAVVVKPWVLVQAVKPDFQG
ncbi:MAG: DUF2288 domain-containing protein [bacterium]